MGKFEDLTGARFGRLAVLSRAPNKGRQTAWRCRCDCGSERIVIRACLVGGTSQSCGCLRKEMVSARFTTHGKSNSRAFKSWAHMRDRCTNPSSKQFADYGGRGITVCDRWADFATFYADMGDPPLGHSIDRIDNNGSYEPGNCRWADRVTQNRNKRSNYRVRHRGSLITMGELAAITGVKVKTLHQRARQIGGRTVHAADLIDYRRKSARTS